MEQRRIYLWTEAPEDVRTFWDAMEGAVPEETNPELVVMIVAHTQCLSESWSLALRFPGVPMLVLGRTQDGYAVLHSTLLQNSGDALQKAVQACLGRCGVCSLLDYQNGLAQGSPTGALHVAYASYASIYRFVEKLCERSGQKVQTMLLTLQPRFGDVPPREALLQALGELSEAVQIALRRNDVYTECSGAQILVLLMDADDDGGHQAANRIRNTFLGLHESALFDLAYELDAIRPSL